MKENVGKIIVLINKIVLNYQQTYTYLSPSHTHMKLRSANNYARLFVCMCVRGVV